MKPVSAMSTFYERRGVVYEVTGITVLDWWPTRLCLCGKTAIQHWCPRWGKSALYCYPPGHEKAQSLAGQSALFRPIDPYEQRAETRR